MGKNHRILLAFSLFIVLASCSKKPLHTSRQLENNDILISAESIEWINRLYYDTKHKIAYGLFNNEDELVIRVMANDKATIMKMFMTGFTVWIDTTGGKKHHLGINYPMAHGRQKMGDPGNGPGHEPKAGSGSEWDEFIHRAEASLNSIELMGFNQEALNRTVLKSRVGDGITAWIDLKPGAKMYYELKIPLEDLAEINYLKQNLFSVGFESGKIDLPSDNALSDFNASLGPSSGRSQHPGGGGRPQDDVDHARQKAAMQTMSEPIKIWMKRIELHK